MNFDRQSSAIIAATLIFFSMIAAQVGTKATRDALFLSTFAVSKLPLVMVAAALLSVAAALAMSRLISRYHPGRLLPLVLAVNAAWFVIEWRLIGVPIGLRVAIYTTCNGSETTGKNSDRRRV